MVILSAKEARNTERTRMVVELSSRGILDVWWGRGGAKGNSDGSWLTIYRVLIDLIYYL